MNSALYNYLPACRQISSFHYAFNHNIAFGSHGKTTFYISLNGNITVIDNISCGSIHIGRHLKYIFHKYFAIDQTGMSRHTGVNLRFIFRQGDIIAEFQLEGLCLPCLNLTAKYIFSWLPRHFRMKFCQHLSLLHTADGIQFMIIYRPVFILFGLQIVVCIKEIFNFSIPAIYRRDPFCHNIIGTVAAVFQKTLNLLLIEPHRNIMSGQIRNNFFCRQQLSIIGRRIKTAEHQHFIQGNIYFHMLIFMKPVPCTCINFLYAIRKAQNTVQFFCIKHAVTFAFQICYYLFVFRDFPSFFRRKYLKEYSHISYI